MDNAVVRIATTVHGWNMSGKANRYLSIEKKRIEMNYPEMMKHYNMHMGGLIDKIKILASTESVSEKKWCS